MRSSRESYCDSTRRQKLLDTGDVVIAEATAKDKIWGIGLNVGVVS